MMQLPCANQMAYLIIWEAFENAYLVFQYHSYKWCFSINLLSRVLYSCLDEDFIYVYSLYNIL